MTANQYLATELDELSIEVSSRCAATCIHCSSGASATAHDDMSLDFALDLIRQGAELGARTLSLSGGEPLLWPHSMRAVQEAECVGYDRVLFYTSGIRYTIPSVDWWTDVIAPWSPQAALPSSMIAFPDVLLYNELRQRDDFTLVPIFSLHSPHPTAHDFIMNTAGAWYNAVSMIRTLTRTYKCAVEVHVVPMAPGIRSVKDMKVLRDLLAFIGVGSMSILRFVPQTRGKTHADMLEISPALFRDLQFWADTTQPDDHPCKVRIGCPFDYRHAVGLADSKNKPCHAGHDLILVRPNGAAHPCAAWKTLTGADAATTSLKEILESNSVFANLRRLHERASDPDDDFYDCIGSSCVCCVALSTCAGGCPAQRLHRNNTKDITHLLTRSGGTMRDDMCPRVRRHYRLPA